MAVRLDKLQQRKMDLAFGAAVVIAEMMPLRLVVDIERRKYDTRRGIDLSNPVQRVNDVMDKWQKDWANSNKGRWI